MIKKITLLIVVFLTTLSYSQSLPIDFESGDLTFTTGGGATYSSAADPENGANTVGQMIGGTDQWNSRIDLTLATYIDMTTASKTITFDFYTTEAVVMTGLVQVSNEENGGFPIEVQFTTDGNIGWETITVDFTNAANAFPNAGSPVNYGQYAQFSIFSNFGDTGTSTYYIDDIAGAANGAAVPSDLSVNAPTPTNDAADVISVYSDAFTSIATNLNPAWGQGTATSEIAINGNNVLKYANLDYQGLEYTSSDVSAMEYVHLDYYTDDATAFEFFLIAGGENAYNVATDAGFATGAWVSLDIPLSFFSDAGRDLTAAFQFKTVGNGTIYLDNIYFWKEPTVAGTDTSLSDLTVDGTTIANFGTNTSSYDVELAAGTTTVPTVVATTTDTNATVQVTDATSIPGATTILVTAQDGTTTNTVTINFTLDPTPTTNPSAPSNDSNDVISVYSDAFTGVTATWHPAWGQTTSYSEVQINGNNAAKLSSFGYEGLVYDSMDVSAMEMVHFDVYSVDETSIKFFLLANAEPSVTKDLTPGSWNSFDISLADFAGATLTTNTGFKFESGTYTWPNGLSTVYIDNVYFWKEPTVAGTDTSLSDLTVDGTTIANFGTNTSSYDVELAAGTTTVPTVVATTTDTNATVVITAATSLPGATTVVVTSQDGTANNTITINFTVSPTPDDYCQTQVTHFNIEAEVASAVLLTVERVDANNVDVSVTSADGDPVDLLGIGAQEDAASTVGAMTLVDGTATIRLTYANGAPDSTKFEILWSKLSTDGNWMLRIADFSAPINTANSCATASVGNVDAEKVRVAPNPTTGLINVTGDIYNTSGQLVLKNSNDLSGLPSGLYFIRVIANGSVSTSKVIKR
jgi:hypothetical protein